jgi:hypothetical protein
MVESMTMPRTSKGVGMWARATPPVGRIAARRVAAVRQEWAERMGRFLQALVCERIAARRGGITSTA